METIRNQVNNLNRVMANAARLNNDPRMSFIGRSILGGAHPSIGSIAEMVKENIVRIEDGRVQFIDKEQERMYHSYCPVGICSPATGYGYNVLNAEEFFAALAVIEQRIIAALPLVNKLAALVDGRVSSVTDNVVNNTSKLAYNIREMRRRVRMFDDPEASRSMLYTRTMLDGAYNDYRVLNPTKEGIQKVNDVLTELFKLAGYDGDDASVDAALASYSHNLMRIVNTGPLDNWMRREDDTLSRGFLRDGYCRKHILEVIEEHAGYDKRSDVYSEFNKGHIAVTGCGTHILYFRNEQDRARGRFTLLAIGKWFRAMLPNAADSVIQDATNAMRIGDVKLVKSYPEWYDAYCNSGIPSCMCHHQSSYEIFDGYEGMVAPDYPSIPLHPVWCYAEQDHLQLAVVSRGDKVVARAIVNTERNTFRSVYGDYALRSALEAKGYKPDEGYLSGCTLRSILIGGKHLLHPYCDGSASEGDVEYGADGNPVIYCSYNGEIDLQNCDGGARWWDGAREPVGDCAHCDENYYDSDCTHEVVGENEEYVIVCCDCYGSHTTDGVILSDGRRERVLDDFVGCSDYSGASCHVDALEYFDDADMHMTSAAHDDWLEEHKEEEDEDNDD